MKAMYIIAGVTALLLVLALTGKKSVHHEISINASVEKVWKTLMDLDDQYVICFPLVCRNPRLHHAHIEDNCNPLLAIRTR